MKHLCTFFMLVVGLGFTNCSQSAKKSPEGVIRPFDQNPKYWEYKNEPVLLLGGSKNDNLFQIDSLEMHLDELAAVGGNYIRNTMSYTDSGNVHPFLKLENGKYDLNHWNDDFWDRFESLLKLTNERDIIVQIEVWDRFDYSREQWEINPFHPLNNVNYTLESGIFEEHYPNHSSDDLQPFFHSIPGMPNYKPWLDLIRTFQEKYINKMLSYSLNFGNVLYCMNNETTSPIAWGNYWIDFIRSRANEKGVEVYLTDMYDHFFKVSSCEPCKELIATPEYYTFMDISQINSRNFGQAHWDTMQVILDLRDKYALRPANNTKVYGGANWSWGSGTNADGIERFCRDIIGGCASARHHRPILGNGLNQKSKASIVATRELEKHVKLWDVSPRMELLKDREPDEAYLTAKEGEKYVIYFTEGGSVRLDLTKTNVTFQLTWIRISSGEGEDGGAIDGGTEVQVSAPDNEGWYAVLTKTT